MKTLENRESSLFYRFSKSLFSFVTLPKGHRFGTVSGSACARGKCAPHCVPWHRPPGQVWCSAGESLARDVRDASLRSA